MIPAGPAIYGPRFRPDIEGLRAVAVLAVVAYHFGLNALSSGFTGVDVFFVISGYLITGILLHQQRTQGRIGLAAFFGRRARRLLPAMLLVTLCTLAAGAIILPPLEQQHGFGSGAAASLFIANFWFLIAGSDYFSPDGATNPFLHMWTLSVEEQFYLFWPLFLAFLAWLKTPARELTIAMATASLVSLVFCIWLTGFNQPWAFFASPARAWEFGAGGLAAMTQLGGYRTRRCAALLGWLGFLLLLVSFCALSERGFPGWQAMIPVAGALCLILSGTAETLSLPTRMLAHPVLRWIGSRSYAIYLWHWPIILFGLYLFPTMSVAGRLACAVLTVASSAASYRLVEKPVRFHPWLRAHPRRSLAMGALLCAAGMTVAFGAIKFSGEMADARQKEIIAVTGKPYADGRRCLTGFTASAPVTCTYGAASPQKTIVLFGDSHAQQWLSPLIAIAKRKQWRLVTYFKASCAIADLPSFNMRLQREMPECRQWRDAAMDAIIKLKPDAVLLAEFSSNLVQGPLSSIGEHAVGFDTWAAAMRRTQMRFQDAGIPVVVLRDTPTPLQDMSLCMARAAWRHANESACTLTRAQALDDRFTAELSALESSVPMAGVVDLTASFCDTATCPPRRNGQLVYRDANHMTDAFAVSLTDRLATALQPVLDRYWPKR